MYGGRGAGAVATVAGTTTTAVVLPNTGAAGSVTGIAVSVFAGLVTWGLTYGYLSR